MKDQIYGVMREEHADAKPVLWQYAEGEVTLTHQRGERDGRHYLMLTAPKESAFFSLGTYDRPEDAAAAFEQNKKLLDEGGLVRILSETAAEIVPKT